MKTGRNDRAIEALVSAKTLPGRYPFYYLEYLEGVTRLNRLDFSAATNFYNYLNEFKGHNYRGSAWQRLAWISLLKGDTADYTVRITQMRSAKIRQTDEDKQAVSETQQGRYPNAKLLRARLLYDGGYYLKALDELLNTPVNITVKSARDMVEYHYRLGRIYQALGSEENAIVHYQVAIGKGGGDPWYFATSASLQMGLMYEKRGEWKKAEASFLSCLSFPVKEYRTSLREKAKAGIERLRQK
jgi:tetratricopeptide (TPR) repeat protein